MVSYKEDKKHNESAWVRRNSADEPRLSELVEMYESLGFEVMLKDFIPEEHPGGCHICMTHTPEKFKVIYTRKTRI